MKHLESYIQAFIGAWLIAESIVGFESVEPLITLIGAGMIIYAQYEYKQKEK